MNMPEVPEVRKTDDVVGARLSREDPVRIGGHHFFARNHWKGAEVGQGADVARYDPG